MRLLADLAFSFKLYELAHNYYSMWKKEFSSDTSPINTAAAFEMLSISSFLQNGNLNKWLKVTFPDFLAKKGFFDNIMKRYSTSS